PGKHRTPWRAIRD
ncbi:hypothetical protein AB1N83_014277, partial [Pleurotus pulmonarius]